MVYAEPLPSSVYPDYAAECGGSSRTKRLPYGSRAALLLVDVCTAYTSPESSLYLGDACSAALDGITELVAAARSCSNHIPIVYAQTKYATTQSAGLLALKAPELVTTFSASNPKLFYSVPENLEVQQSNHRLDKQYPSAFFGTNLATQLTAQGVDTVFIVGFATSGSVRATTLDAMQSGFRAMVVADACADYSRETHFANLFDVGAKYCNVVALEEAKDKLRDAPQRTS